MPKKRILVAPLNWGLGHATRCIPLIHELIKHGFEPVLASDGAALELLKKEFPSLQWHNLPSYKIRYARNPLFFSISMLLQAPHILKCIYEERKITETLVQNLHISGIISDNRWGVRSPKVISVFITHQLKVYSGTTTFLSTLIQRWFINKFNECWVPDTRTTPNLSGSMGHVTSVKFPVRYIGPLSRLNKKVTPLLYDITVLLSGPEPQREMLETILENELKHDTLRILFIRGVLEEHTKWRVSKNISRVNYLTSKELEKILNGSAIVISRAGYTSLMDLSQLEKKAFFIPTPGQPEQEYLAKKMKYERRAPFCHQGDFTIKKLEVLGNYKNLTSFGTTQRFGDIFALFKSE